MNPIRIRRFFLVLNFALLAMMFGCLMLPFVAYAQTATADGSVPAILQDPATGNALVDFLTNMVTQYPKISIVISIVGLLRLLAKPIMTIIEAVVKWTPSTTDDEALAKFEAGPIWKWILWGLDWLGSIKLPSAANTAANPLLPKK